MQHPADHKRFDPAIVMIVVTFIGYSVSFMDRQIVSVLIEPIKAELHIPDGRMGMLTGLSFALFYCVLSLPIAALSDRVSRKRIIVTAMAFWSVMTALFGFARNYGELFVARMAVGGGEAAFAPAAYSMIADYFPPKRRGVATGIIAAGSMVGATCGLVLGGYVAEHAGWRTAMKVAAVPGIVMAIIFAFAVREPRRELSTGVGVAARKVPRFSALIHVPAYLLIVGSAIGAMFVLFACVHWFPAYLMRTHHMSQSAVGAILGPVLGGAGVVAMIASGFATDLAARKDARWTTWIPAIAALAGVPLLALAFWTDDQTVAIASFGAAYFAVMFQCTPIVAAIQGLVLPNLRARASAVFMLSTTLVGSGAGPTLAGYLSDMYEPAYGHDSLRYALLTLTPVLLISPLLLTLAAPWFVRGRRATIQEMSTRAEEPA